MYSSFSSSSFLISCLILAGSNAKLEPQIGAEVCQAIEHHSEAQGFEPELILGMAWVESRMSPGAVNDRSGARGVMQVILGKRWSPDYSAEDMLDPWLSVEAGVLMALRWREKKGPNWLECYNSGVSCRNRAYNRSVMSTVSDIEKIKRKHERGHSVARGDL